MAQYKPADWDVVMGAQGCVPSIRWVEQTHSTNSLLMDEAERLATGAAVFAGNQTQGRGRLGRVWVGKPGDCLMGSILLRPTLPIGQLGLCSLAVAVAILDIVDRQDAAIKWPNDVLDGELKKLAGILIERCGGEDHLVIGIGLNVHGTGFEGSGWLDEDGKVRSLSRLAKRLVERVRVRVGQLETDAQGLLQDWRARNHTLGSRVKVGKLFGIATDVQSDGGLVLRTDEGKDHVIRAGDVQLVRTMTKCE